MQHKFKNACREVNDKGVFWCETPDSKLAEINGLWQIAAVFVFLASSGDWRRIAVGVGALLVEVVVDMVEKVNMMKMVKMRMVKA